MNMERMVALTQRITRISEENEKLRAAIKRALADAESGEGWGPDVTVCAYLREALAEKQKTNTE
jgi:uncharacterized protein (UPF0335 family)